MKRICVLAFVLLAVAICPAKDNGSKNKPQDNQDNIVRRDILIEKQFLNLPVKNGANNNLMKLLVDGSIVQAFTIEYGEKDESFWVFIDVSDYKGKTVTIEMKAKKGAGDKILDRICHSDNIKGGENLYKEELRPQFHFTSRRGWNNDPDGLVYYKGEWHLFYQHNPFGIGHDNMHWGHAVSTDLLHWKELKDAICPDELGTIFSGSAVVDFDNSAGFQKGDDKTIVAFYTSAGGKNKWSKGKPFTQSIAYSNDRGRTWTKYQDNPVIGHIRGYNRDPKVIRHNDTGKWVMVVYLDKTDGEKTLGFFTSDNLKEWERESTITGFHECPELFELAIDGDENNTRWVLYGANGKYHIGDFDGKSFTPETEIIRYSYGDAFYASQTWNNVPAQDGRRIQIAWAQVKFPEMPFSQMMTFPVELTLHTTDDGIRMYAWPVREIETIRTKKYSLKDEQLSEGENPLKDIKGELFDIVAEFEVGDAKKVILNVRGVEIVYDVKKHLLVCNGKRAPLKPADGKVRLRVLADRGMRDIFGNGGQVYMPIGKFAQNGDKSLKIFSTGGNASVTKLDVYELESVWR